MKKKILLVDDSKSIRTELSKILIDNDYEVIEAENGQEGLEKIHSNLDISLIISDINMPVMDGMTMSAQIYKDEKINKIPLFILTTEISEDLKKRAKKCGVL
ncbi:MAG: response regulator, partial [Oligoflexia bacterium]|nr:response regulator [Oligoflexia bacterium]